MPSRSARPQRASHSTRRRPREVPRSLRRAGRGSALLCGREDPVPRLVPRPPHAAVRRCGCRTGSASFLVWGTRGTSPEGPRLAGRAVGGGHLVLHSSAQPHPLCPFISPGLCRGRPPQVTALPPSAASRTRPCRPPLRGPLSLVSHVCGQAIGPPPAPRSGPQCSTLSTLPSHAPSSPLTRGPRSPAACDAAANAFTSPS